MRGINVTNGTCLVRIYSDASASNWCCVDEISQQYQTAIGPGGRLFVLGLSFEPAQKWAAVDGKARLVLA